MTDQTSPKPPVTPEKASGIQKSLLSDAILQSMSAVGDTAGRSKQTMEAVTASGALAAKTMETLNSRALAYSRQAADDAMAAGKALAAAKTPQEAVELQTSFATRSLNAYITEFSAISGILVETFNQSLAPFGAIAPRSRNK